MVKEYVVNKVIGLIKNNANINYDSSKLEEIKYGLEAIYLTMTKIFFIVIISIFLKIIKEVLLVLLFFNVLRATGFGLHAPKSSICWVLSTLFFIGGTYLCKFLAISKTYLLLLTISSLILISIYAPADTKKRPLIKKKKRIIFKILTIVFTIIYIIIISISNNVLINNILTFCIVLETILILPISYKILGLPYRNYINYYS